jgi:small subunit ribosomal protein S29
MTARITLKVPNPKMLSEIIDYGISNAFYATNAVYEVME